MDESLKQKTFSGLVWNFLETFALQGFGFVQGIILARHLLPSDYGLIAMTAVFFSISYALIDTGFTSALIRKQNRKDIDYSTVYVTNIVLSCIFSLVLWLCSPFIADFYEEPELCPIICANALLMLFGSFIAVQGARLTIQLDFKLKSKIVVISTISTGIISILLAYCGLGVWSLVLPNFFSVLMRGLLYWKYQHWFPGFRFSWNIYKEYFSYGSKLMLSTLLNTTYDNVYSLVIGKVYSSSSLLGYYTKGCGYASLPASVFSGILNKVTFPVLSKIQEDDVLLEQIYRKMIRVSAYVVFPLMILLFLLARPLVIVLITEKWANCIIYIQILCFSLMWNPIHSLNLNLLLIKGKTELFLKLEIVKKIIGVITLCVTIPFGIITICYGQVFLSLLFLVLNTYYTGKFIHVGFFKQMKDLLPTIFYTFLMGLGVWVLLSFISSFSIQIIAGIGLGIPLYLVVSKFAKSQEYTFLLDLLIRNVPFVNKNRKNPFFYH